MNGESDHFYFNNVGSNSNAYISQTQRNSFSHHFYISDLSVLFFTTAKISTRYVPIGRQYMENVRKTLITCRRTVRQHVCHVMRCWIHKIEAGIHTSRREMSDEKSYCNIIMPSIT